MARSRDAAPAPARPHTAPAFLIIGLALALLATSPALAGMIIISAGERRLEGPPRELDRQRYREITFGFSVGEGTTNFILGLHHSRKQMAFFRKDGPPREHREFTVYEISLGVRHTWRPGRVTRPYLGGGLTIMHADLESNYCCAIIPKDGEAIAPFLESGVFLSLGRVFVVGVSGRIVALTDHDLLEALDILDAADHLESAPKADYAQLGFSLGFMWE